MVLGRLRRENEVEEIIAGRMAFHFVMVLVGLSWKRQSQPNASKISSSGSFPLAEYFFT